MPAPGMYVLPTVPVPPMHVLRTVVWRMEDVSIMRVLLMVVLLRQLVLATFAAEMHVPLTLSVLLMYVPGMVVLPTVAVPLIYVLLIGVGLLVAVPQKLVVQKHALCTLSQAKENNNY